MPSMDHLLEIPVVQAPRSRGGKEKSSEAVTSFWENLLPTGGGRPRAEEKGVYVGEALPPVPRKLANQMQKYNINDERN